MRRDLDGLPAETSKREKALERAAEAATIAKRAQQALEVRSGQLELNIRSADDELQRLEARLNQVRTNAEFDAVKLQIKSTKDERSKNEEEVLALLDQIESAKSEAAAREREAEQATRDHQEFLANCETLRAERSGELAVAQKDRERASSGLAPDLLDLYDRLFRSREGLAVVSVENLICQGCYTGITPNDEALLTAATTLVQCKFCSRIVYLD
jgi:predicted  nucleic acid-binding Zn-ribbon protein